MARHPPLRNRVQQLSRVPVALWRRLVNGVAFVIAWLTVWVSGATLATALACLLALWVWSGSSDSLRQVLAIAQPWVPALETLEMEDDTDASVRNGGELGTVRWTDGEGLRITASDVTLTWDWLPLLKAEPLAVVLKAGEVHISDERPPATDAPAPPEDVLLPVSLQAQLDIARLTLPGAQPVVIRNIQGTYGYDGDDEEARHRLNQLRLEVAQGSYEVDAALQAVAPLALEADIRGQVRGDLPALGDQATQTWQGRLTAHVQGALSHADPALRTQASLDIQAQLHDETAGTPRTIRPGLQANATVHPWQAPYLHALKADLRHLNLAALWPQLPTTVLSGQLHVQPVQPAQTKAAQTSPPAPAAAPVPAASQTSWQLHADLNNAASGPWDQGRLPVTALQIDTLANAQGLDVSRLQLRVGQGSVQGQGRWRTGQTTAQGQLVLKAVPLHELHTLLKPTLVSGSVGFSPAAARPAQAPAKATAQATPQATDITIDLSTPATPDRATGKAVANHAPGAPAEGRQSVQTVGFGGLKLHGQWTGRELQLSQLWLHLLGAEVRGQLNLSPSPWRASGQLQAQAPGWQASTQGHLSDTQGEGQLKLQAGDLAQLAAWLRTLPGVGQALPPALKLGGEAQLALDWQGGWLTPAGPALQASLRSSQLSVHTAPDQPPLRATATHLTLAGNLHSAQLVADSQLSHNQLNALVHARTHTGPLSAQSGQLVVDALSVRLHNTAASQSLLLSNQQATTLSWANGSWQLTPGQISVQALARTAQPAPATPATTPAASTLISWQQFSISQGVLSTQGQLSGLTLDWLDAAPGLLGDTPDRWLSDQGLQSNLSWDGRWHVRWPLRPGTTGPSPDLKLDLQRTRGDLRFRNADNGNGDSRQSATVAADMQRADLHISTQGQTLQTRLNWDSRLTGQLSASFQTAWQAVDGHWQLAPQSPLQGQISANLTDISHWSPLVTPPGWRAHGRLNVQASVGGTLGQPDWQGELSATNLSARSVVEGLEFGNGRLLATLSGEKIHITQLELEGAGGAKAGGRLSGSGLAQWHSSDRALPQRLQLNLQAKAEQLRVSSRADRRLTLSGDVSANLQDSLLKLRGELAVDQALFILPDETTPALGTDVVVRQTTIGVPDRGSRVKTDLLIHIALGRQLEVRGQGLQTHLGGQVSLISSPSSPGLRVLGEVRTLDGSYQAYGQRLKMQEGVIRFSGPYDDPTLSILALRPASAFRDSDAQVVGVKITGSARAPLVKLYANPDLPDSEKLAWLVLGRPASGTGAEAAILQQAALALLSGSGGAIDASLASRLGLDEIAFRGSSTQADGTTQAAGVALGKRLSNKLYVAYETSLNTAMGTVSLFYDVSRRLTLRARAGEENAIDLIFTIPHD